VQALEQIVAEQFGLGGDPHRYWKQQDDGIHVLAIALYSLMTQQHFAGGRESFPVFLKRALDSGELSGGKIEALNRAFSAN
jgi:hypothetical protein